VREVNANFSGRHALRGLRWSYSTFISAASIAAAHGPKVIVALAVTETLAAIAFAIEPAEVCACGVLLLVYCVAGIVSAVSGDWVAILRFIFYAVTATYIVLVSRANKTTLLAA
jgi:hypothetical protein